MSWTAYSVGDLCEVFDGPHATPSPSLDGPIYLGITSITQDGTIDFENSKRISYEDYPKWTKRVTPQKDDVVFSYEANLDSFAIIPEGFEGCLGRRMAIMRPNKEKIKPRFLYYYLLSPKWKAVIAQKTVLGATVNRIPIATYPSFPIDIPCLEEQRRITGILSAYDSLIENNRKQIKLLEEAAQRLYKEWFIDLRFPGHEDTEIDPETGLPEGWERKRLGELADYISRGVAPKYADESDWHVLGQTCIRNNLVLLENSRKLAPINDLNKIIRFGDVLINSTGVGSLGRTAQVWFNPENITVDSHVTIVRDTSALYSFYLGLWAFSNEQLIESLHTGSTGQTELPKDRLASIRLLKPPSNILLRLNAIVEPLVTEILAKQNLIASLSEVRNRLLPRLMEGEIEL